MKILILSCNTGGGHNAAAFALKESLEFHHHEAEVLDLMRLGRKHTSALIGGAYVNSSPFSGRIRRCLSARRTGTPRPGEITGLLCECAAWKCTRRLYRSNHFDGVATTHLYPAETLTWMKQKGLLTIPCVAIATDYACIPFWEETNCDDYVIPHKDLIPEFASYGIPKEKLLPLGIPVRPAFRARRRKKMCAAISVFPRMLRCFSS